MTEDALALSAEETAEVEGGAARGVRVTATGAGVGFFVGGVADVAVVVDVADDVADVAGGVADVIVGATVVSVLATGLLMGGALDVATGVTAAMVELVGGVSRLGGATSLATAVDVDGALRGTLTSAI
jgi:hypothetical protein